VAKPRDNVRALVANEAHPLQRALFESNFALPKAFVQHLGDFARKLTPDGVAASVPLDQLNIATLVGMKSKDAIDALGMHKVSYEERPINSRAEIPLSARAFQPFAAAGEHVVLFETDGAVVDAQSMPAPSSPAAVAELRTQLQSLRAEVESLKSNAQRRAAKKR
jgi:negative regulator of sigma E activity